MIVPDLNLLLYAYNSGFPQHAQSARWWKRCTIGDEPVRIPAVVAFGFLRTATNRKMFRAPMTVGAAISIIETWLAQPHITLIERTYHHRAFVLLSEVGTGGNLVSDAQIAAAALEEGGVVHTADADFRLFIGLKTFNPLT